MLTVYYGLIAALVWGSADFAGGIATKKSNVYLVVLLSHVAGGLLILGLIPLFGEEFPGWHDVLLGGLAGMSGAIGLLFFYQAMARGPMGVVAPVTAVLSSCLPVAVSFVGEGIPDGYQLAGIFLALPAVWMLSQGKQGASHTSLKVLVEPAISGIFFGLFLVLIDTMSEHAIMYPLLGARVASVGLIFGFLAFRGGWRPFEKSQWWLIALTGMLDMGGNAFFALASRVGRLDIAAVLSALAPAVPVLLARIFLKERLLWKQRIGVALALGVVVLLSI